VGKRHRRQRKLAKLILFKRGYKETELGELKKTMSKAEARLRLANLITLRFLAETEILDALHNRSIRDIQAIEDANVFGVLVHAETP
jgi:hypothetical protein